MSVRRVIKCFIGAERDCIDGFKEIGEPASRHVETLVPGGRHHRGERRTEPILGSNPIAYLIYDAAGHFAVQFMKRDRKSGQATEEQATGGANNSGAIHGYDAYFGRYTVGPEGTVTQELEGALTPADVGKVVTRLQSRERS